MQKFKKNAKINSSVPSGADFFVRWDCGILKQQQTTGLTLTPFEATVLGAYTGEFYTSTTRLLRSRKFKLPAHDFSATPNARVRLIPRL